MNNKLAFVIGLAVGATVGAGATCKFFKNKYKQLANEEITAMREYLVEKGVEVCTDEAGESEPESEEDPEVAHTKRIRTAYDEISSRYKSTAEESIEEQKEEPLIGLAKVPYVISPDEFGEKVDEGYECVTLVYYADNVLADFLGDLVEDVDLTVGLDALNHFGDYEDDCVHVRNDELKIDYEVLLDQGRFVDIKREVYSNKTEE